MRMLQVLFGVLAAVGILAGCAYHKTEVEDGGRHDRHVVHEIELDD